MLKQPSIPTTKQYLTEENLKKILMQFYDEYEWICDKTVPSSNIKNRPDFRSDKFKLIIEFDGFRHYSQAKIIFADLVKDKTYSKMGYRIVRIPYFVQFCEELERYIFNEYRSKIKNTFGHGFISKECMLPADFNYLGEKKFKGDLVKFKWCRDEIILSLENRPEINISRSLVYREDPQ